ncbi:hypothetical protein [Aeromonas veronii]|uniref:hypothetical protein n=1 Tax=Aeromonas TaxID=642 RepID=UPI003EC8EFCB
MTPWQIEKNKITIKQTLNIKCLVYIKNMQGEEQKVESNSAALPPPAEDGKQPA